MPVGEAEEIFALALVFVVHVVGGVMLVWALLDREQRAGWRRRWRGGGGGGGDEPPQGPQPPSDGGRGTPPALPLPGGEPSRVRVREPARVAERYPRPGRRPSHPPGPAPQPEVPAAAPRRRRGR